MFKFIMFILQLVIIILVLISPLIAINIVDKYFNKK